MRLSLLTAAAVMALALTACHQEGPAEKAGHSLDNAGKSVSDTLNPPKGPAQSAGRKLDNALGN
jgi:predicted small lipoprotein YifL